MKSDLSGHGHTSRWQWDAPLLFASSGFLLMTAVAVGQFLRALESFETLFKELGVQIPGLTVVTLNPWTHLIAGATLTLMIGFRHRRGIKEWATALWVVTLLTYIAISHAGLFEPLILLVSQIGMKVSG